MFRDCTRTCVIAQCVVPRQPTLSCLFYLSERTSGFAIPTTELEKAYTLFTEINHCVLIRWLSQPSEAIKKPRLNDLNRSALKGYKLAVTRSASTKTSRNTLTILQKACIQLVKVLIIKSNCCTHVSIKRFGSLRVATRRIWLTRAPVETRDLSSFLRRCYSCASTPVSSRIANLFLIGVQACT